MFKVNSEKELLQLLKIVAQESVSSAKRKLNESSDPAQGQYAKALEYDQGIYGDLVKEQDDEGEEIEDEEPAEDEEADTDEKEEEELDPEEFGESFENVIKDINNLRAGKSTKNKEIREELESYFERLDDNERKVLHLFIYELSDILKGAITGDEAQDPSDPPFGLHIDDDGSVESGEEKSKKSGSKEKGAEQSSSGLEDTAPPIKVNERQDLHEIRRKVKRLMKRY